MSESKQYALKEYFFFKDVCVIRKCCILFGELILAFLYYIKIVFNNNMQMFFMKAKYVNARVFRPLYLVVVSQNKFPNKNISFLFFSCQKNEDEGEAEETKSIRT